MSGGAEGEARAIVEQVRQLLMGKDPRLTAADFRAMGLARCKELAASGKAAPVVVGNAGQPVDEFANYDINAL